MAVVLRSQSGQMSVEVAVVAPVVIVVAIAIANIMSFLNACAKFDRVSLDAVVAHGVSPSGMQGELSAVEQVQRAIEDAMGESPAISIEVSAAPIAPSFDSLATLNPNLARFTCTMRFRPWPQRFRIAGASFEAPFEITHSRSLAIDRYRPGVVI